MTMGANGQMPPDRPAEKWYEKPGGITVLVVVVFAILVVFETFMFRGNPAALVKVLGGVGAFATAMAGFVAGRGIGKKRGRAEATEALEPAIDRLVNAADAKVVPVPEEPVRIPKAAGPRSQRRFGGAAGRAQPEPAPPPQAVAPAEGAGPDAQELAEVVNRAYRYMDAVME